MIFFIYSKQSNINAYDNTYGDFTLESYNSQKDQYEGKTIYYNIIIEDELYTEYEDNCELCLKRENICITCKNNYTIAENESIKNKTCLIENDVPTEHTDETTQVVTEKQTEVLTEGVTEVVTEKQTEVLTEAKTETLTEKQIEELLETDIQTEKEEKGTIEESYKTCTEPDILDNRCTDGMMKKEQIEKILINLKENY